MLYVVAGSYKQYADFIREYRYANGTQARWVQDERAYRGRRGDSFALVGTYWERSQWQTFVRGMFTADFSCVYQSDGANFITPRVTHPVEPDPYQGPMVRDLLSMDISFTLASEEEQEEDFDTFDTEVERLLNDLRI